MPRSDTRRMRVMGVPAHARWALDRCAADGLLAENWALRGATAIGPVRPVRAGWRRPRPAPTSWTAAGIAPQVQHRPPARPASRSSPSWRHRRRLRAFSVASSSSSVGPSSSVGSARSSVSPSSPTPRLIIAFALRRVDAPAVGLGARRRRRRASASSWRSSTSSAGRPSSSQIIGIAIDGGILYYLNQPGIKPLFGRA